MFKIWQTGTTSRPDDCHRSEPGQLDFILNGYLQIPEQKPVHKYFILLTAVHEGKEIYYIYVRQINMKEYYLTLVVFFSRISYGQP